MGLCAGRANSATTTVTYQVSTSADDGFAQSAAVQDITSAYLKIGDERTYAVPYQMSGMRFGNVNIPRSATIISANLKISSINTDYRGQIYGVVQAEASDNPTDFSGRLISNAVLTAASVAWDFKTAWSPDTQYINPDISNIVQEVVNRHGFSGGNSIAIYYSTRDLSGKGRSFASYEYSPASAAVLEVTYETYTISGHILTTEATPLEGVSLSAGANIESTETDASGYYELKVPPSWSGIVTPNKTDWGFSPVNQPYSNVSSDQLNQGFTAFQPVISGYVKDGSGAGIDGVSVSADNGGGSYITNTSGYYEIIVPYDWSGTVTPNRLGWGFTPSNHSYSNVTADQVDQDFTAVYVGIIVKSDGTGDFATIQAAIDAAVNGDVVVLQPGTFIGYGNRDIDFKGKAITVRGATGDPNDVIIDCQGTQSTPHRGFKFISGEDTNSILEKLIIINGFASLGGGIYCNNSSPMIQECAIRNNTASYGGGIYCHNNGNPIIQNCTIKDNTAQDGDGGGLYLSQYSNPMIEDCIIASNIAQEYGGGIRTFNYSHPTIENCIIKDNIATQYDGGGIYFGESYNPVLLNCTIANNMAGQNGGGIYCRSSNSVIKNCMLASNLAGENGGGIYCYLRNPTIQNDAIINNYTTLSGAAIYCNRSDPNIYNCTITGNATTSVAGIHSFSSNPMVNNCIVWGHLLYQLYGSGYNVSYSNIQGGYEGLGNIDIDPCFIDNYHISPVSPCINAGDPNYIAEHNETDVDGDTRVICRIDMGADEIFVDDSAAISVVPNIVDFQTEGKFSNIIPKIVEVLNYGAYESDWHVEISGDCSWLTIQPLSEQTPSLEANEISISIDQNNIDYGTHSCQFQVVDSNAVNSPQVVTVTIEVLRPELTVSPAQFYFETALDEPNMTEQILSIQNAGYDTLRWQIAIPPDCNWLSVEPVIGQSTGEINEVTLSVDANGMDIGFNTCELTISDPNAGNSPLTVQVSLHVYIEGERHVPAEYDTIQAAINAAVNGDVVVLQPSTYWGDGNRDIDFKGKAITVRGATGDANNCVIDCQGTEAEPHRGFNFVRGEDANSVLEGLKITHGYSSAGGGINCHGSGPTINSCIISNNSTFSYYGRGGGIYNYDSSPSINNCTISGNSATYYQSSGGGICNYNNSNPSINNCTLNDNRAKYGGGICNYNNSNPSINNCTISNNSANRLVGAILGLGGGIYNHSSSPSITDCTISDNLADYGGGISNSSSSPTISNCIISNNSTDYSSGGGIYNDESSPIISNCIISNNSTSKSGGGIYNYSSSNPSINNCTISNNSAGAGGGILNYDSSLTMTNCFISGNSANNGGGMYNNNSSPDINNCIINNNSASNLGSAIYNWVQSNPNINNSTISNNLASPVFYGWSYCYVRLNNCIVWGNQSSYISSAIVRYCDVEGGHYGVGNIDVDPCFAQPGFWHLNNTPTDANDDFWVEGDYHLKSQTGRWQWSKYIGLDPTGDGFINLSDFAAFANSWHKQGGSIPADLDRSGFVDLSDLKHLLNNYLADYPIGEWLLDDVTSPCIDAGDPNSDWTEELWPHGKRINMGAYGGTPQASMSNSTVGNIANLDNDISDVVDYNDLGIILSKWCRQQVLLTEDLNRDGVVNSIDYAIFANNWLTGLP